MLRKKMWPIYRKLSIIGILCFCVYLFGYSDNTTVGFAAAPCIQFCENNSNDCNASCEANCSQDSTDNSCEACMQTCSQTYFQCLGYAIYCSGQTVNPARCDVDWVPHCPVIGGVPNCQAPGTHYGYALKCNIFDGPERCVACPDHEYCTGSGNLPPCLQ